jgi:hypothetical protein
MVVTGENERHVRENGGHRGRDGMKAVPMEDIEGAGIGSQISGQPWGDRKPVAPRPAVEPPHGDPLIELLDVGCRYVSVTPLNQHLHVAAQASESAGQV